MSLRADGWVGSESHSSEIFGKILAKSLVGTPAEILGESSGNILAAILSGAVAENLGGTFGEAERNSLERVYGWAGGIIDSS